MCVQPPSPQRASSKSPTLAASGFLHRGSAGAPVTTGDQLEMDPGLLHLASLGLLSESAGDTEGPPAVGDDTAVTRSATVSSTGSCLVPGHATWGPLGLPACEGDQRRSHYRRQLRLRLASPQARSHGVRTQRMDWPRSPWDRLWPPP
ncbi:hypothetical protein HPB47_022275 [Ixodes persulcatus]|uniref:Uncharacterized protein n=1 Tax=Ixodes persulcatus TaxID=34615 RepID=A0AC60QA43_IXOPE|nr:hypothetical protein HPB47_022275 [Ixodes persulcatus]